MQRANRELLRRLVAGESIDALCRDTGWSREEIDQWWRREAAGRAPRCTGEVTAAVKKDMSIERDRWGIPHIFAESEADLWFGFGYAMAQDRLFQLDICGGRAGEAGGGAGPEGLPLDIIARTVGLNRIARAEWSRLPAHTQQVLQSFAEGINAWIEACGEQLPIEFDLLDYRPEPWTPIDSLVIESEFRWYLTGRLPVIVMPELAKRVLGEGALYARACSARRMARRLCRRRLIVDYRTSCHRKAWDRQPETPKERAATIGSSPAGIAARDCRWSPAIHTSPSKRCRAGTRRTSAAAG
jgi:hypothetical protein